MDINVQETRSWLSGCLGWWGDKLGHSHLCILLCEANDSQNWVGSYKRDVETPCRFKVGFLEEMAPGTVVALVRLGSGVGCGESCEQTVGRDEKHEQGWLQVPQNQVVGQGLGGAGRTSQPYPLCLGLRATYEY